MARLTKERWLNHALAQLSENGFTSLKADTLAKSLGVSRGSFYWHFDDLAAFHAAVLQHWLSVSVLGIVEKVEAQGLAPEDRLRELVEIAAAGDRQLEKAVRAWAFTESTVKKTVDLVDAQRLAYISQLMTEMQIPKKEVPGRALQLYLTSLGYWMISDVVDDASTRAVIEAVLANAQQH